MNTQQLDPRPDTTGADLLLLADEIRMTAAAALNQKRRPERGQFLTPSSVARLMASMFSAPHAEIRLLDAGAGAGSLTAAAVAAFLARDELPTSIEVVAYELEQDLEPFLQQTLEACGMASEAVGVSFSARIEPTDFLEATARCVVSDIPAEFNTAILNPPYRKIRTASEERARCREMGLEVSNLYAAFVGATLHHLEPGAELDG